MSLSELSPGKYTHYRNQQSILLIDHLSKLLTDLCSWHYQDNTNKQHGACNMAVMKILFWPQKQTGKQWKCILRQLNEGSVGAKAHFLNRQNWKLETLWETRQIVEHTHPRGTQTSHDICAVGFVFRKLEMLPNEIIAIQISSPILQGITFKSPPFTSDWEASEVHLILPTISYLPLKNCS